MKQNFELQELHSFGIPVEYSSLLEKCIANLSSFSESIYLTGSWALKEGEKTSDIDFLAVVNNVSSKSSIVEILKKYSTRRMNRRVLDAKVIMKSEIQRLTEPKLRFYYWNQIHSGILLFGNKFSAKFGINESVIEVLLGELLDTHNHICANLESNLMFTGTAALLYETVKTAYYIERYLGFTNTGKTSKNQFIRGILDESYLLARNCYYNSISTSPDQMELRFLMKTDSKFKTKDYRNLLEAAIAFKPFLLEEKREIVRRY
ncbi:MAG: nucleotidyltransferase domain-containing protein [Candidatus Thorarchaeota archaeon]|nr:nucleotidyltransferase domain-containing protein [Candidatus Thorarchaeota archaeon]